VGLNGCEFDPRPSHHQSVGTGMGNHRWAYIPAGYVASHPGQLKPPMLCWTGNEYQPNCGDALRLDIKGKMALSIHGLVCGWQVKLCDSSLTRAILSAFEMCTLVKRCCTNVLS